jgi:hypothetical protein
MERRSARVLVRFLIRELLDIKKDSFTRAAQMDVKLPAARQIGIPLREERGASILGHEKKNGI